MGGPDQKFVIPDWKKYKIDGIKDLENLERLLAARGLKDPWIRNEVWRFSPENYKGLSAGFKYSFLRGFKYAAGAMVLTILAEKFILKKDEESSHH